MKRIFVSDLYRLFRSYIIYILPVTLTAGLVSKIIRGQAEISQIGLGEVFDTASGMMVSIVFLLADIVAVYFWNAEQRNGYIKNIAGSISNRQTLAFSKMLTGMVIFTVFTVFSLIHAFLSNICCGIRIVNSGAAASAVEMLLRIFTGIVSLAIMLLLYEVTHSSAVCYITAIMIWTGMIETMIIQLTYLIFKWENTGRYMLRYGLDWENSGTAEDVVRSFIYLAVFLSAAVFVAKKQDVRS